MLKKLLFRIAKRPFMGKIVGKAFQHCSWAIPVKKVYSSKEIIAFCHPHPSYENHIIISPKRAVKNLQQMAGNEEYEYTYFRGILHSIDLLNVEFNIVQRGYSLVCQYNKQKNDKNCPVFHIVSGK